MPEDIFQQIKTQVEAEKVVLYMKGTPSMPQCGFSQAVVAALGNVGRPYAAYNVLDDPTLREGIKKYSNWPTIPQLYVDGEFVGGADIIMSMLESGELAELVSDSK